MDIKSKNIIFDLGEVLFKPNILGIAYHVGIFNFILYVLSTGKGFSSIKPLMFGVLNSIDVKHIKNHSSNKSTYKGEVIPNIMVNWLAGISSDEDIRNKVASAISKLKREDYFKNNIEANLIKKILNNYLFNPCVFSCFMKPISSGVEVLKDCYDTKKHELYVLSNWDPESFNYLYKVKHNNKVFKYLNKDNIVISGNIGLIKPNKDIYKYILNKYNLDPKECIFIDDQEVNVKSAQECNITGIWLKDSNYAKLRQKLRKLNIIN